MSEHDVARGGDLTALAGEDLPNLLSIARTALDDPAGVGLDNPNEYGPDVSSAGREARWRDNTSFAVAALDEAIGRVDVELRPRQVLTTAGRLIAEVAEALGERTNEFHEPLADQLERAGDLLDEVIAAMPEEE